MTAGPIEVVAALVHRDGRLLVTRRPEGAHLAGLWEFPGGKIEPGERPEAALVRELVEELAIEVTVGALRFDVEHAYPEKTVRIRFYECTLGAGTPRNLEVAEHRWVRPDELGTLQFPPADAQLIADLAAEGSASRRR